MKLPNGAALGLLALYASLVVGCTQCGDCGRPAAAPGPVPGSSSTPTPVPSTTASSESLSSVLLSRAKQLRQGGREKVRYLAPSQEELTAYQDWITQALQSSAQGQVPASAPQGFAIEKVPGVDSLWMLVEHAQHRRGAGALLVRLGPASPVIIEAPHTFHDEGTLPIAIDAFERHQCRALLFNTVHRYNALFAVGKDPGVIVPGSEGESPVESDVAHAPRSFFLTAHEALVRQFSESTVVQLHGFGDDTARGASVVISAATTKASLKEVAESLRLMLGPDRVRTYPDQVRVLGATTNVEGRASARLDRPMIHVEMSHALRDELVAKPEYRAQFLQALIAPLLASVDAGR